MQESREESRREQPDAYEFDDLHWKRLTDRGNRAFGAHDYRQASEDYDAALEEALRLFRLAFRTESLEAVPILIISYHNAAENRRGLGDVAKALELYRSAYRRILSAAEAATTPTPLRLACIRNLPIAMSPLLDILQETGAKDREISAIVEQARAVAQNPRYLTPRTPVA